MTNRAPTILFAVLFIALADAALALSGGYRGLDEAEGMRLEFARGEEGRVTGVLTEKSGAKIPFDADPLATGAETIIERGGRRDYFLF
ncbi:MAG: hypothetical protein AAGF90_12605, partial [Pseudomonadota bacterium]